MGNERIFYGACLLQEARRSYEPFKPEDFVSDDKTRIINLIKEHKGSRFKGFTSYDDAIRFVQEICDNDTLNNSTRSIEAVQFPSIDIKSINAFKKAIETKNLESVIAFVESNPFYLISIYFDSPTIIKHGPRYNAVHVAVRSNAPDILEYILKTVSSIDFIKLLYPSLNKESIVDKRNHLLDLYLNTPDKVNFDTPLHFACKIGSLQCISKLISYAPICDTKKTNKQNKLPSEVVTNANLKQEIEELLNSSMFITLVNEGDMKKTIKEETLGRKLLNNVIVDEKNSTRISAIVGPLTPEKAQSVYERLKSPKNCTPEQRKLRLEDPERGLERATRNLCYQIDVPYEEYWPFLGEFTDLRTKEGLSKLEKHLRLNHAYQTFVEDFSDLKLTEDKVENAFAKNIGSENDSSDSDDEYVTAPSSPIFENSFSEDSFIEGSSIKQIDYDVEAAITLALDQNYFTRDELRDNYPYLYHWYRQVSSQSN